jgi:predicted nucleotidyltransferase
MTLLNDEYYKSKWNSIVNIFHRSGLNVAAIAKAGSRARLQHHCESDLDVIFFVNEDPIRTDFYVDLMDELRINFQEIHNHKVYPGEHFNVVHLETKQGGIFDFVLLSEYDFEQQHGNDVEWRRDNL